MILKKSLIENRGFTLVEVLVALVILSIGLLGVAGMQIKSMTGNHNAFLRSQAQLYANEMLEMMRANYTAATNGDYNITLTAANPTLSAPPTVAEQDLIEWRQAITGATNVASGLPGGQGGVNVVSNAASGENSWTVTITVQWTEGRLADDAAPSIVVESKL